MGLKSQNDSLKCFLLAQESQIGKQNFVIVAVHSEVQINFKKLHRKTLLLLV